MKVSTKIVDFFGPVEMAVCSLVFAIVIGASGFVVSYVVEDPQWASRFGSLVVVYGLVALVFMRWRFGYLRADGKVFEEQSQRAIRSATGSSFEDSARNWTDEMNKYGEFVRNKWFFLSEVLIIGLGTLQWGFGDLLHCLFNGQGCTKC